jgi:hypothetical protein
VGINGSHSDLLEDGYSTGEKLVACTGGKYAKRLLALMLFVSVSSISLFAQQVIGTIRGVVTDPWVRVVANASVNITK